MAYRATRLISSLILSNRVQSARRSLKAMSRRMGGAKAELLYFHQPDDPYSHLAAQVLSDLRARYDIDLQIKLVDPPLEDVAPEREALQNYGRRDAASIAPSAASGGSQFKPSSA